VLSKFFEGSLIVVCGLPRVVAVSAGVQHAAALAADGRVFVWGFNPSGQLGIGSDRAIATPRRVLDGAHMVACGSQNTWALLGPGPPKQPTWMKGGTEKGANVTATGELPFSERLLV
jgi:alpha-tubulin suppressor-like RCC1 family protein